MDFAQVRGGPGREGRLCWKGPLPYLPGVGGETTGRRQRLVGAVDSPSISAPSPFPLLHPLTSLRLHWGPCSRPPPPLECYEPSRKHLLPPTPSHSPPVPFPYYNKVLAPYLNRYCDHLTFFLRSNDQFPGNLGVGHTGTGTSLALGNDHRHWSAVGAKFHACRLFDKP